MLNFHDEMVLAAWRLERIYLTTNADKEKSDESHLFRTCPVHIKET